MLLGSDMRCLSDGRMNLRVVFRSSAWTTPDGSFFGVQYASIVLSAALCNLWPPWVLRPGIDCGCALRGGLGAIPKTRSAKNQTGTAFRPSSETHANPSGLPARQQ